MIKTKQISKGDWRTVEWFFNANGTAFFKAPAGAQIKARVGTISDSVIVRMKQTPEK